LARRALGRRCKIRAASLRPDIAAPVGFIRGGISARLGNFALGAGTFRCRSARCLLACQFAFAGALGQANAATFPAPLLHHRPQLLAAGRRFIDGAARLKLDLALHFLVSFLDLPAALRAMAIACFWGRPLLTSRLMFSEIVFWEVPFLSGM
jgi:hypothetical protein